MFSRIRLREAKYDNPKLCDTSLEKVILIQFIVDLTFSWTITPKKKHK